MKALSSILGMCIVLASVVGCGKDDTQNEITFKAVVHKSTKAPITHSWYAMTDPEFGIYAFRSEGGQSSLYISNARCTNDKNPENLWYTTPTSYWPASGTLTFMAYSPFMASGVSCDGNSLTVDSFDISSQDDLLYTIAADATGLTAASAGAQYGYDDGASTTATGVPIRFRHALSLVEVWVKTDEYSQDFGFQLTSAKLNGFDLIGSLNVQNSVASWPKTGKSGNFAPALLNKTDDPINVTATSTIVANDPVLLIPSSLSDKFLEVSYKMFVKDLSGNSIDGGSVDNMQIPLSGAVTEFLPGKKYIITLTINGSDMTFNVKPYDWYEANGDINIQ